MTTSEAVRDRLMVIGGANVAAREGGWIDVESPATKEVVARVPRGTAVDVDVAVSSASEAFREWSATSPETRSRALYAIAAELTERTEELARQISIENGNALRTQSRPEAARTAELFQYLAGLAHEIKGLSSYIGANSLDYTRHEPYGVVGAIVPWNSPVSLAAQKIAPAVCFGNTIVLKASEVAPLGVLMLAEICNHALPPGVVNVITGYGSECGAPLVEHPGVPKLTFTGSTAVGRGILVASAARVASVSLELGGKSAQIVFPDVEVDAIADGVISAMRFTRQGQSCTAGSRLFVHEDVAEALLAAVQQRLSSMTIGDPLSETTDIGAIVSERQFDRVCSYVEDAVRESPDSLVMGGRKPTAGPLTDGYFYEPTVFRGLPSQARLDREEVFGPVLSVHTWNSVDEVLGQANDSPYGLAGYIWCRDGSAAVQAAHRLQAGWVMINRGGGQALGHSYGGMKQSGLGRELSLEGMLDDYTQIKQISMGLV